MQVSVTFRHMDATEALKTFAADKVARIQKYVQQPTDAHVVLSVEKYMHKADVTIKAHGLMMRGEEKSEDMYASIDRAVAKIERQLQRYKNKLAGHKAREGQAAKVLLNVLGAEAPPTPDSHALPPQVVETKEVVAPILTVDEAVMQMDLLHNDFLVFVSATSGRVNVLYRRKEGNYGLIETPSDAGRG